MHNTACVPSRHDILTRVLSGDTAALAAFTPTALAVFTRFAKRLARDLPHDLRGEVVNEAFAILLGLAPDRYDPVKGTIKTFLYLVAWEAARVVRAAYTPPGQRTRKARGTVREAAAPIDRAALAVPCPTAAAAIEAVEQRVEVTQLLAAAPADIRPALHLIVNDDLPLKAAALSAGLPRTTFNRRLKALARVAA